MASIIALHCESSPGSFYEHSTSAERPPTFWPCRLDWAADPPKLAGLYSTTFTSTFTTTQRGSWYSFYHPAKDKRL